MEDEKNDPVKEETTKKIEEGGDPIEEETMAKKMEEGGDPMEEETTTKNMEEASGPMEEKTKMAKTTEDEENNPDMEETTNKSEEGSGPKEEETSKKMEEERKPEKKMEAESKPSMVNVISQREMKGKMIVTGLGDLLGLGLIPLPPRIHNLSKFERMQAGSSSRHLPSSDEVILEHRPLKIHDKQESGKLEEEIGRIVMPSLFESNVPEPECIEGVMPQMEVDCDERKAEEEPRRWRPPEKGWLKMNVEGLISEHWTATSAVVRNSNGGFLAAISGTFDPVTHVNTAKLLALRNALLWAETGIRVNGNYLVELNCEQVVQDLRDFAIIYRMLPDDIRDIMDECLTFRMHFRRMQFVSVSAGENRVAHCLASRALHHGCEGEWYAFDAPDWLQEAIMEDLPN